MSSEIAPIREDEAEDCGLPRTPDHKGRLGWPRSGAALTPIGSPALEKPQDKLLQNRPHASSFSFRDPFRAQERPNSAPDRVLGRPVSPGSVFQTDAYEEALRSTPIQGKPHPPSPEQATFHPQPQRHQPWAMALLESEASPGLDGEVKLRPKPLAGWDENSSAPTLVAVPTPVGTSCGTPALDASTPSPEQMEKDTSPKPRSVQNTPEPVHHYGCGAAISTPSPCAMSSLNHMLGLPRFNEGMLDSWEPPGPMLPPPLPAPGSGPADVVGMGYGGHFRPAEVPPPMPEMPVWGMRSQDTLTLQQMATFQAAYQWGAASALQGVLPSWRMPGAVGTACPMPAPTVQEPAPRVKEAMFSSKDTSAGFGSEPLNSTRTHARTSSDGSYASRRDEHEVRGRNGKGRPEKSLKRECEPSEAQELVGQVGQMSRTQAGSKFLQRQLLKGSGATVEVILAEVEGEIASMMCDPYGNYLCSAAFQACSQRQRKRMLEKLAPRVAQIACDKRGTHALQALIGLLQLEDEQRQLMTAMKSQVVELSMDPNGTHVVQRLLSCFLPSVTDWIFLAITERMVEVSHHPYGLCVLKKCISQAKGHEELLLKQLARHAMDLVQSPYGNYAIQHALEEWGGQRCQPILRKMEGRLMQLSIQKFSSNVVEKLFSSAPADFRHRFIAELVESEKMSVLVNSNYGHFVAKRALEMATPEQSEALIEAIRANLAMLPSRRLRVKWEKVMNGQGDLDGDMLKVDEKMKRSKPRARRKGDGFVCEQ